MWLRIWTPKVGKVGKISVANYDRVSHQRNKPLCTWLWSGHRTLGGADNQGQSQSIVIGFTWCQRFSPVTYVYICFVKITSSRVPLENVTPNHYVSLVTFDGFIPMHMRDGRVAMCPFFYIHFFLNCSWIVFTNLNKYTNFYKMFMNVRNVHEYKTMFTNLRNVEEFEKIWSQKKTR